MLGGIEYRSIFRRVVGQLAGVAGAAMVGFLQSVRGSFSPTPRTLEAKGRELVTSDDFGGTPPAGLTGVGKNVLTAITAGGDYNTAFGEDALKLNTSGYGNTALGFQAMKANTTGGSAVTGGNTAVGASALLGNTTGDNNTGVGLDALYQNTTGYSNTAVGSNALGFGLAGYENVAVGWRALFNGGAAHQNVAVGVKALNDNTGGDRNVAIGYYAGFYETGDDSFYLDNKDRGSAGASQAGAMFFGVFNATPASQTLRINAQLTLPYNLTGLSADLGFSGTQDILSVTGQAAGSGPIAIAQNVAKSAYRPLTVYSSSLVWGQGTTLISFGATALNLAAGVSLQVNATQVVSARRTGWTDQTAAAARADLGAAPTVGQLASFCRALYDDLKTHGLIGA